MTLPERPSSSPEPDTNIRPQVQVESIMEEFGYQGAVQPNIPTGEAEQNPARSTEAEVKRLARMYKDMYSDGQTSEILPEAEQNPARSTEAEVKRLARMYKDMYSDGQTSEILPAPWWPVEAPVEAPVEPVTYGPPIVPPPLLPPRPFGAADQPAPPNPAIEALPTASDTAATTTSPHAEAARPPSAAETVTERESSVGVNVGIAEYTPGQEKVREDKLEKWIEKTASDRIIFSPDLNLYGVIDGRRSILDDKGDKRQSVGVAKSIEESMIRFWDGLKSPTTEENAVFRMKQALLQSQLALKDLAHDYADLEDPGRAITTPALLAASGTFVKFFINSNGLREAVVGHVGDTKLYLGIDQNEDMSDYTPDTLDLQLGEAGVRSSLNTRDRLDAAVSLTGALSVNDRMILMTNGATRGALRNKGTIQETDRIEYFGVYLENARKTASPSKAAESLMSIAKSASPNIDKAILVLEVEPHRRTKTARTPDADSHISPERLERDRDRSRRIQTLAQNLGHLIEDRSTTAMNPRGYHKTLADINNLIEEGRRSEDSA